jgi:foldase protein PrsA
MSSGQNSRIMHRNEVFMKKIISCVLVAAMALFMLAACGNDNTKVVLTTGFGKDEVFTIGDESCKKNELMVYLVTVQNQYENVYGEEIWNASLDGVTLEDNVKDTVLARIAQIKTMCLLAGENNVVLDEDEQKKAKSAAQEYYASLNNEEKKVLDINQNAIEKMYSEYALADKVYSEIIKDINPEISDDEARIIKVQHIFFSTTMKDGSGKRVDYSDREKQSVYEKAENVREMAVSEEYSFEDLASRYSDDSNITLSFGKGEMETAIDEVVFNLETDEVSSIVEGDTGYHIFKCISTFDREETDANKLIIVEKRKDEVFGQEYNSFVNSIAKNLNEKLWDDITLVHDENVTTSCFFEIYDKYFQ